MKQLQISFILFLALFMCAKAWGNGRSDGDPGFGAMAGGYSKSRGARGFQGSQSFQGQNFEGPMGRNGRQSYGGTGDSRKYRSNLYNDDDVYGYDATYPNGEAAYINYRTKDARARRGPEFARTSRAYSRQNGGGERGMGNGQVQEYGRGMW